MIPTYARHMARWQIPVTIDGHTVVLVLDADSAAAAAAQLTAHRARTAQDPTLHNNYLTDRGDRIDIRWGRTAVVDIGSAEPAP